MADQEDKDETFDFEMEIKEDNLIHTDLPLPTPSYDK